VILDYRELPRKWLVCRTCGTPSHRLDIEEKIMSMPHFRATAVGRVGAAVLAGAMIAFVATGALSQDGSQGGKSPKEPITAPAPPESGFEVIVIGVMEGVSPEEFSRKVVNALPAQLLDPQTNFTRQTGFRKDRNYRMVIAFHGEEMVESANLCTQTNEVDTTEPPPSANLMSATRITAAFCEGSEPRNTATDRMVGSVNPNQAGFRFLVSDIAKQLFPDGFGSIPGTISAQPPGTMVTPVEPR
jgi:hypothetical protein